MWKKKALAILTAAAMAGSAIQPVMAQNYGRDYGNGYDNGNNSLTCEDRSYEIDTYYSGFEAGRPHARYDWRSPRSDAYGYLEVGDYYRYRGGYRCANYTQQIYVHGRPELARGVACRQPDGTWRMT